MESPENTNEERSKNYLSSLTNEQLWEAYIFLKESLDKLPKVSSYKMLYIILHYFRDKEKPMYEFAKIALSLKKKLKVEIEKRNIN
jgi:hypothetical protein